MEAAADKSPSARSSNCGLSSGRFTEASLDTLHIAVVPGPWP